MVGKTWLGYSCRCAPVQTLLAFYFFFVYMDCVTNDGGPGCYLQVSKITPTMGLDQ